MGKEMLETMEFWVKREQNLIKYLTDNIEALINQGEAIEGLDLFEQHSLIIYQDILEKVKSGKYE